MMKTKKIPVHTKNPSLDLALDTISLGKQALVFTNMKKSAEKTAEDIAKHLKKIDERCEALAKQALEALSSPTKQCERLAFCLRKGIAFHHAGLVAEQRALVEDNFRNGTIKIICATPSLAMGVDLPAFRSILKDVKRYTPRGYAFIPVLEYLQMAGRAGRPKFDKEGEAICIASHEGDKKTLFERYVHGKPEEIYSKVAVEPVLRTYILSLIASQFVASRHDLIQFFEKTFWAHQFQDMLKLSLTIDKMIALLEEWELIDQHSKGDFVSAADLHDKKLKATLLGRRVSELYIDPLTAHNFITLMRNASHKKRKLFSYLQMISDTGEMKPLLRVSMKEEEKIQQLILENSESLFGTEPSLYDLEYEDFQNSIKTAAMLQDWAEEKTEEFLLEEYNTRPGELRAKLDRADWLVFSAQELCKVLHFQNLLKELIQARVRLQYGIKEELLALVRFEGIGRVRSRVLFNNRIRTVKDVKDADISSLSYLVGRQTAIKLKKQVGEEIKEIPPNKRKGQIRLGDYSEE